MATVLVQVLLAMAAASVLGFAVGIAWTRARLEDPAREIATVPVEDLENSVEATESDELLREELARARADLDAHAVELADANGEIVALLADLHEARSVREPH